MRVERLHVSQGPSFQQKEKEVKKILIITMVFGLAACGESDLQRNFRQSMENSCYDSAISKGADAEIAQKRCACIAKRISSALSDKEITEAEVSIQATGMPGEKVVKVVGEAAQKCFKD